MAPASADVQDVEEVGVEQAGADGPPVHSSKGQKDSTENTTGPGPSDSSDALPPVKQEGDKSSSPEQSRQGGDESGDGGEPPAEDPPENSPDSEDYAASQEQGSTEQDGDKGQLGESDRRTDTEQREDEDHPDTSSGSNGADESGDRGQDGGDDATSERATTSSDDVKKRGHRDPEKKGRAPDEEEGRPEDSEPDPEDEGDREKGSSREEAPRQDVKTGPIGRFANFGEARDVYFYSDSKDRLRSDPTRPYPRSPRRGPQVASRDQIELWEQEVENRQIVVLGCLHTRVLYDAVHEFLGGAHLVEREKRLFDVDLFKAEAQSELSLYSLAEAQIDVEGPSVIVVSLTSQDFLDTMFWDLSALWSTEELLKDNERYLVVVASDSKLLELLEERLEMTCECEGEDRFFFERIPFLRPLLQRNFPEEKALSIAQRIEVQHAAGLWGAPSSEAELFLWVRRFLKDGGRSLEEEIQDRACPESVPSSYDRRRTVETIDAQKLFDTADPVARALLYTVSHFPGLHPSELERLMEILLSGEQPETETSEEEESDDLELTPEATEAVPSDHLLKLWCDEPDRYLSACHVHAVEQDDGTDALDFEDPYLRRNILQALRQKHPLYLWQKLNQLLKAGLLAEESKSTLHDQVISITVDMALADPGRFHKRWLIDQMIDLRAVAEVLTPDGADSTLSDEDRLRAFLVHEGLKILRRRVLAGLSDLIREMLRHDRLAPLVNRWLDELLKTHRSGDVLILVRAIFRAHRSASEFDALHWFRRLLDETSEADLPHVYEALVQSGIELNLRIYDLVEPLSEWLPDPDEKGPPKRPSSLCALRWLADYSDRSLRAFRVEDVGAWPSRYSLFATLRGNGPQTTERLQLLARWLFHPAMKWIEGEEKEIAELLEEALWNFRAAVIEEWYLILHGSRQSDDTDEVGPSPADEVGDALLCQVVAATRPQDRPLLLLFWRSRRSYYMEELRSAGPSRSEKARQWQQRRKCSLRLERRFKEISLEERRGSS